MKPDSAATRVPAATERYLLVEILDLHARGLLRMPWIQALIVLGIGLFAVPSIALRSFLLWAILSVAAEALRARFAAAVLHRRLRWDPSVAHSTFIGLAGLSGTVISAGGVAFFPQLPVLHQALFGMTLFALPAAGAAVSSSRYILGAYAVCVVVPAAVTWSVLHPSQALGLGALSIAYCITIFLVAADGEKLVRRSVVIRHERDQLVQDLEQRNAEVLAAVAQAEQSAQARARVLAAASHDLRQPLHALSLYSAVLAANPPADTVRELGQSIDQIVRSLGNLLNGLLDLSRLSAAHYVPDHQVVDIAEVIGQVCAEYQHTAAEGGLQMIADLVPARISCDPLVVERIARNLVDNAIKYTDKGEVQVTTRLEQDGGEYFVLLGVADTGRGIPVAEQERIFEEFYQIDNPGRDHTKGVGLGLAIVRRLCELIGASVRIASTPGRGTRFDIRIPATIVRDKQSHELDSEPVAPSILGKRIFVVDDESEILRGMQELFRTWGVEALTARSPHEANQLFNLHGQPDLMIADLRLGVEETGVGMARRLRKEFGDFPILIITGETSSDALVEANELGLPLLQKPIAPEVFRRAIMTALV